MDVVRLNLGGGKEVMALGRSDVLRMMEDGPFLVARRRVIIAGVSLGVVEGLVFSTCEDKDGLWRDMTCPPSKAGDDSARSLLEMMVVVISGVGVSDKTTVGAALSGMVHLRGFWGRLALRFDPTERAIKSLRRAICSAWSSCLISD